MNDQDIASIIIAVVVVLACLVIWARHDMKTGEENAPPPQNPTPPDLPPDTLKEQTLSGAQIAGAVFAVAGLTGMIYGLGMEIDYRSVVNLGLMNDRLVTIIASGFGLVTGAMLIIFGKK